MRRHSITNPLTEEEQRAGLRDDPGSLSFDDLLYWIDALDHDLATLDDAARPAELVDRLRVLRGEMETRTASRPVIEPVERIENSVTYHVGGIVCDEGENEGVVAVTANINPGPNFPESVRIVIGAPPASPLMAGYIPELDGFAMSVEVAERLVATVQHAIRDVRAATAKKAGS